MKKTLPIVGLALIIMGFLQPITNLPPSQPVFALGETVKTDTIQTFPFKEEKPMPPVAVPEALQATIPEKQYVAPQIEPKPATAPLSVSESEIASWKFFESKGLTANQIAGIMGNLKQEHGFKTSDVAGGLGIAQWLGARRANLLARADPYNLNTQLNFLWDELNSTEIKAFEAIKASNDTASATRAFQNKFERCGKCMESQRIQYAHEYYHKFAR